MRDEAEVRGHRRTYIGSMPGKVIQSMRKAKRTNPLFLLDEIDKMGSDFRGDPAAALLEVLDPEQNATFNDHYLEVDYDLSNVMFVTTANTLNIPPALMDRMEIIRLAGYTEDEKIEIAKRHLLPGQRLAHGLEQDAWTVDDAALLELVRRYTREGRRSLARARDRQARPQGGQGDPDLARQEDGRRLDDNLESYLGVPKYRYGEAELEDQVGIVTGLAWTEVGGELLTIEGRHDARQGQDDRHRQPARRHEGEHPGRRNAYVRSRSVDFGIHPSLFEEEGHPRPRTGGRNPQGRSFGRRRHGDGDHLGADGYPGAQGCRHDGRDHAAWPRAADRRSEGEKLLAALRGGIKTVIIPEENVKDLSEIPGRDQEQDRDRAGRQSRRRLEIGARQAAGAARLGRGGGSRRCREGRGRQRRIARHRTLIDLTALPSRGRHQVCPAT